MSRRRCVCSRRKDSSGSRSRLRRCGPGVRAGIAEGFFRAPLSLHTRHAAGVGYGLGHCIFEPAAGLWTLHTRPCDGPRPAPRILLTRALADGGCVPRDLEISVISAWPVRLRFHACRSGARGADRFHLRCRRPPVGSLDTGYHTLLPDRRRHRVLQVAIAVASNGIAHVTCHHFGPDE